MKCHDNHEIVTVPIRLKGQLETVKKYCQIEKAGRSLWIEGLRQENFLFIRRGR